jgi:diadenylate cyclase
MFQPEIRRALEHIGHSKISNYGNLVSSGESIENIQKKCICAVTTCAAAFQMSKTGALIVFERQTKLGDIIETGTIIDAEPSVTLIGNIFFNKAPLHDGAVIIRDGRIYAAGCILPLTKNENVSTDLGTRHRAAIGMSENSDAILLTVSEETGNISLTTNGVLKQNYTKDSLRKELEKVILSNDKKGNVFKTSFSRFFKRKS